MRETLSGPWAIFTAVGGLPHLATGLAPGPLGAQQI